MVAVAHARPNAGTKGVPRLERETQILRVATEEFGSAGFAGTNIQAVADRAGISKPLIYNYFGSKECLYAACLDHAGTVLGGEIERIARGDAVGLERGLRTLAGMFTILEPQPYLWRLLHDPTAPTTGAVAETVADHTDRIAALAHEGVTELLGLSGNTDPLDISAMTATWLGIVDSLMGWWVDHPGESADAMLDRCVRLVRALFSDAARGQLA
ncbi:transcriptional regulator, TetR family [Aeromicrobium marinum DSM 15272]|uniref:Transcriptional regulator, TetR family n=1 Tax=Aeromicrobium marinum DSM 15272 TaxID=585531 RepID=E2SBZ8_9ACTN|nr:TetR/AcrR family transcriptional regulator [Aeromicrobium marinum]EFQ83284.1 transcriptional regulator, TetR family [Aeromicrobium marinum DSM 15272]